MRAFFRGAGPISLVWLAARLVLAYETIPLGWDKVFGAGSAVWVGPQAGLAVAGYLRQALSSASGELPAAKQWYAWLIQNAFLPHAVVLSYLVAVGEVLVGIALLLGIFTRFSVAMALLQHMALFYAGTVSMLPYVLPLEVAMLFAGHYAGYSGVDGLVLARVSPWFRPPLRREPSRGASRVWEVVNPLLVLAWVVLLVLAILWG